MRDVVVMFIVNRIGARGIFQPADAPREDREIFLDTAEDINGAPMDHDLRAKLCLAYLQRRDDARWERRDVARTLFTNWGHHPIFAHQRPHYDGAAGGTPTAARLSTSDCVPGGAVCSVTRSA